MSPDTEFWVTNFLSTTSICNGIDVRSQEFDNDDKKGQFGWGNKRDLAA